MATYKPNAAGFLGTHFKTKANRIITDHLGDYATIGKVCVKGIYKREFSKLRPLGKIGIPTSTIMFCYNLCDYPNVACGMELEHCQQKFIVKEIENKHCGMVCLILNHCGTC